MAISISSPDNASIGLQIAELAIDPVRGGLLFPIQIVRGTDAIAQRIRVRFQWFKGEWFLDQREGIPYYESILVKNPDKILINFIFRKVLLSTPGVKSVQSFNAALNRQTRNLTVDFQATLEDNSLLSAQSEPFIIDG